MDHPIILKESAPPIESLSDFLAAVKKNFDKAKGGLFFRGHSKHYPDLRPTLFRNAGHRKAESQIIHELLAEAPAEFEKDQYQFDRLVRAQHYGAPTRLLDISTNPLIALYFACQGKREDEGEVFLLENRALTPRYFLSDTVSCKANLSRLSFTELKEISSKILELRTKVFGPLTEDAPRLWKLRKEEPEKYSYFKNSFNETDIACRLVHFIREEKPHFCNMLDPISLYEVEPVLPKKSNQRILAQSGAFLLFGMSGMNGLNSRSFTSESIRISAGSKADILQSLTTIDIAEHNIFPEIAELGKAISKRFMSSDVS